MQRLSQERDLYLRLLELGHSEKIEPLLAEALALAVKATGAARGLIRVFRTDDDEEDWSLGHHAEGTEPPKDRFLWSRSIEAEVLRQGCLVRTSSAQLDPRFSEFESAQGIEAVMCAPLGTGEPIGVIYLYGGKGGLFEDTDQQLAERLALHLGPSVRTLVDKARADKRTDATRPWRERLKVDGLIGRSKAMADVFAYVASVAPLDVGILLTGASGTGKSAIAKAIHDNSGRRSAPFVEVNCAALPEALVENELFGAVSGAHSTADMDRPGKVAAAEKGTLFLDEIGELPLPSQAKLLSLIERKMYYRLGDTQASSADIRIVAATNADLKAMVAERQFREDLIFRLSVVPLRVPNLSERIEDIDVLCEYFRDAAAERNNLPKLEFSPRARLAVRSTDWPGNVRQLANAVEAALIRASSQDDAQIQARHVFEDQSQPVEGQFLSYHEATRVYQAGLVEDALKRTDGNVAEAARQLDITRAHVYNLIRTFGLRDR